MKLPIGIVMVLALVVGLSAAQEPEENESIGVRPEIRERIDAIHDDLEQLRFEKVLSTIESTLSDPTLSGTERFELLVMRSQTHGAFGDLGAAEADYVEILGIRPTYRPDESLTPNKAMDRFDKARTRTVGTVRLDLDPPDARLAVDGTPITAAEGSVLMLLAGEYTLQVRAGGYDPLDQRFEVVAGQELEIPIALIPNARTIIVRTEQSGVTVSIDGEVAGTTRRGGFESTPELVVESVPLGDHVFELSKDCHRAERYRDNLTVNMLDPTPKRYRVVSLAPSRTPVEVTGAPPGTEVRIDGTRIGRTPLQPFEVCPGERRIEARFEGRTIWSGTPVMQEAVPAQIRIDARPNLVLVGAERWPAALGRLAERFNTRILDRAPRRIESLTEPEKWQDLRLDDDVDLAIAVLRAQRKGVRDRWLLYSPILRVTHELDVVPDLERPDWSSRVWGLFVVDSSAGGAAQVARVGGPAAKSGLKVGDRVTGVDGTKTGNATAVARALEEASAAGAEIEWIDTDGKRQKARVEGATTPSLIVKHDSLLSAMWRAAWAVSDAGASAEPPASALANLALLFSEHGHPELAVSTWRRVRWKRNEGIGAGTKMYYLAAELQRQGREEEAVAALRSAASTNCTTFDDEGPAIAPAARDRLADLGVRDD